MCLAHDEQFRLRFAKSKPVWLRLLRYPQANPATGIFGLKDSGSIALIIHDQPKKWR